MSELPKKEEWLSGWRHVKSGVKLYISVNFVLADNFIILSLGFFFKSVALVTCEALYIHLYRPFWTNYNCLRMKLGYSLWLDMPSPNWRWLQSLRIPAQQWYKTIQDFIFHLYNSFNSTIVFGVPFCFLLFDCLILDFCWFSG